MTTNSYPPESSDPFPIASPIEPIRPTEPTAPTEDAMQDELLCVQSLLADQIDRQREEITALRRELDAVTGTISYRFLGRLWPLRRMLIPPHSRREQFLKYAVHRVVQTRRAERAEPDPPQPRTAFTDAGAEPEHGAPVPLPRVTVLNPDPRLDAALRDWAARQTWPLVDVCAWDEHTAWGNYVCVGSADLLTQPATWLEASVLVLERERPAYVVTVRGLSFWMAIQFDRCRLPGAPATPLLRTVARSDCVAPQHTPNLGRSLTIDVREYVERHERGRCRDVVTIGRIIDWTSRTADRFADLPFQHGMCESAAGAKSAVADAPVLIPPLRDMAPRSRVEALPGASLILTRKDPLPAPPAVLRPVQRLFDMPPATDPRPTVLLYQPFLAMGGAERVALDVIKALADRIRFIVAATDAHDAHLGTTVERFRAVTPYVYTAHDFLPHSEQRNFLSYLIGRYRPRTFYVANGSAWLLDALPSLRAECAGMRIVNQVYDHRIGWIERYDARLVAAIDVHIGANENICSAYERRGAAPAAIMHIPHGIDLREFDPAQFSADEVRELRRRFGLPVDGKVVTFIGRLHPQKRPLDFVELARQMKTRQDVAFLMVGDGPYAATVNEQIRRLRLHDMVLRPFHEPSREIFAASDLVVLPSQHEGMPLVVLEAQAMGKPVVATDVGNVRHILAATQGGVIVNRIGNPDMLRRAVSETLSVQPDVRRMRAVLAERYEIGIVAEQYARALLGDAHEETG